MRTHFGFRAGRTVLISALVATLISLPLGEPPAHAGGMPSVMVHHHGVTLVQPDLGSHVVFDEALAVPSPNSNFVAVVRRDNSGLTLASVLEGKGGAVVWSTPVNANGVWRPEAISNNGQQVILGMAEHEVVRATSPYAPPVRRSSSTFLHIAQGQSPRLIVLPGTLAAEAFSVDGTNVVMIDYVVTPHDSTDSAGAVSYRVRPLHLASGALGTQQGNVKTLGPSAAALAAPPRTVGLEETVMRGVRRNQTWNPNGTGLYTLYDASTDGAPALFVHALNLDTVTATCLAVPGEIDAGGGNGTVLFTGGQLVVAGRKGIAILDARTGLVKRLAKFELSARPVLAVSSATLWISEGTSLSSRSLATLRPTKPLKPQRTAAPILAMTPLPYGPLGVLDADGTIWFAGPGVDRPIRRGQVNGVLGDEVVLHFGS